ncbi:sn-1-glycerol-3-phosphate C16:0-DCA-CoA acyl transferase [Desmophyllum pertusum]|uniref:Sn-1-glycerol-3-phosphate C16:0-DCA-CoA acyl transferase n=1 Tax=Desmophyllum pertusum TaxID=174260 RepID=A0A9W9ZYR1_9CNID|nr:sn-1-glycerol-3-phosphate C16:0-DCA-CoA acyl transferase [Desmophyllum pertusum]
MMFKKGSFEIGGDIYPVAIKEDESAAQFANRVKTEIARQGGLVDLIWDGQLKRTSVKPEFRQQRQEDYASTLKIE